MARKILLIAGIVAAAVIATALTGILWAWVVVIILSAILLITAWRGEP